MNYRLITFAIILFVIGQGMVWIQINGPLIWDWAKKYKLALTLVGIPITYIFMEGTRLTVTGFEGLFWPGRFVSFVSGIIIFTAFTYFFKGEGITLKTAVSLTLASCIILIQLFWK
jgi:hypothetical protein